MGLSFSRMVLIENQSGEMIEIRESREAPGVRYNVPNGQIRRLRAGEFQDRCRAAGATAILRVFVVGTGPTGRVTRVDTRISFTPEEIYSSSKIIFDSYDGRIRSRCLPVRRSRGCGLCCSSFVGNEEDGRQGVLTRMQGSAPGH